MIYAYPCDIASDEDGELVATFPDVPVAITGGKGHAETLRLAADPLSAALAGYVHARQDVPEPSTASPSQELVPVPAVMTAKLALHSAMRAQNITCAELAHRPAVRPSVARKLTDPDSRSRIGHLQEALDAVGCQLVIDVTAAYMMDSTRIKNIGTMSMIQPMPST